MICGIVIHKQADCFCLLSGQRSFVVNDQRSVR